MAVQSKAQVFGRFMARITGSNPADGMDVHVLCWLCVVYALAEHSYRCVCLIVCDVETSTKRRLRPDSLCSATELMCVR